MGNKADSGANFREGAIRMADTLKAIYDRTDFREHPYESDAKVAVLEEELREIQARGGQSYNVFEYAKALLDAGRTSDALYMMNRVLQENPSLAQVNDNSRPIYDMLSIGYLRLAEQNNCIDNHNEESCIFPISGGGIHLNEEGSRKAIEVYERILEAYPKDYQSMYLLNVAYQTLREYPDNVPQKYLLPLDLMGSKEDFPEWRNISSLLGVDGNYTAGGVIVDDFDNDGFIDIITSGWNMKSPIRFFRNNGDGTFVDRTIESGLGMVTGGLNMISADYNNDGHLDFLLLRGAWKPYKRWAPEPNSLFRNNGDGTFSDVTFEAGIYSERPTQAGAWFDYNNDGHIDLFIGNETIDPKESWKSEFYINNGDGTFRDGGSEAGLSLISHVKGAVAGDINNDGWTDLFISVQGGENILYLNRDGKTFLNVTKETGMQKPIFSFPCMIFDINQDGWEDVLVFSYDFYGSMQQAHEVTAYLLGEPFKSEVASLYINNGDGSFSESAKSYNLAQPLHAMGCNYGDLDNDGYLDIYVGTGAPDYRAIVPNRMFLNKDGQTMVDVTSVGRFGHIQKGHAIGFADLDNDGNQDIYANMGGAYTGDIYRNAFFHNPGNDNKWVTLQLEGTKSNRAAIGARVKVKVTTESGEKQTFYHTCSSGGSFGANSLQLEIGLGKAVQIDLIEINWPNGENNYEPFGRAGVNRTFKVVEGTGKLQPVERNTVEWQLEKNSQPSSDDQL